ncbi:GM15976 [Drosophila sechellia]|uniref:GM15976 n=1 Tax=Drosophila sechellia TaxID=7238 RepID=B4I8E4_DROSE|nr:GM15976 [Drosophila sechellia]
MSGRRDAAAPPGALPLLHLHVLPPKKQPQWGGPWGLGFPMAVTIASMAKALCLSGPSDRKHFDHAVVAKSPTGFLQSTHYFTASTQESHDIRLNAPASSTGFAHHQMTNLSSRSDRARREKTSGLAPVWCLLSAPDNVTSMRNKPEAEMEMGTELEAET